MKRFLIIAASLYLYISNAAGQATPANIEFSNEASDTTRLTAILVEAVAKDAHSRRAPQSYVAEMGRQFLDTPYKGGTLEGENEMLRINLDGMDCTTFIENVMALALTAGEGRSSWRDFAFNPSACATVEAR